MHPSAGKVFSRDFALTEFAEVRDGKPRSRKNKAICPCLTFAGSGKE